MGNITPAATGLLCTVLNCSFHGPCANSNLVNWPTGAMLSRTVKLTFKIPWTPPRVDRFLFYFYSSRIDHCLVQKRYWIANCWLKLIWFHFPKARNGGHNWHGEVRKSPSSPGSQSAFLLSRTWWFVTSLPTPCLISSHEALQRVEIF